MASPIQKMLKAKEGLDVGGFLRDVEDAVFNNSADLANYTKDQMDLLKDYARKEWFDTDSKTKHMTTVWPTHLRSAERDRDLLKEMAPEFGELNYRGMSDFLEQRSQNVPAGFGQVSTLDDLLEPILGEPISQRDFYNTPFHLRSNSPNSFILQGLHGLEDELADTFLYHRNKRGTVGDYKINHLAKGVHKQGYSPYDYEPPAMYASGHHEMNPGLYGSNIHPMLAPKDFTVINQQSKPDLEYFFNHNTAPIEDIDPLVYMLEYDPDFPGINDADQFWNAFVKRRHTDELKMPTYHVTDGMASGATGSGKYDAIYGAEGSIGYPKDLPQGDVLAILDPDSVYQPLANIPDTIKGIARSGKGFNMNSLARQVVPSENTEYAVSVFKDLLDQYGGK